MRDAGVVVVVVLMVAAALALAGGGNPPSIPTGLSGSQGNCVCANLTWNASTDDVTPQASIKYDVQRDGADIGSTVGTTSYQDTVAAGTYAYRVRAVDQSGFASAYTNPVNVTVDDGCR